MTLQLFENPLDLMKSLMGKAVVVKCKAYKEYDLSGILLGYDMHMNLVLSIFENKRTVKRFVKGDNVLSVEESN